MLITSIFISTGSCTSTINLFIISLITAMKIFKFKVTLTTLHLIQQQLYLVIILILFLHLINYTLIKNLTTLNKLTIFPIAGLQFLVCISKITKPVKQIIYKFPVVFISICKLKQARSMLKAIFPLTKIKIAVSIFVYS